MISNIALRHSLLWLSFTWVCMLSSGQAPLHADVLRVEFSELARVLPWEPSREAVSSGRLKVYGDRMSIGPGRRWAEALLVIDSPETLPRNSILRVAAYDFDGDGELLVEDRVPVTGGRALLRADMRSMYPVGEHVRVRVELSGGGDYPEGVAEIIMQAAIPQELEPTVEIPVRLNLPDGALGQGPLPLTFGVPFPQGALWDSDLLSLVDALGNPVPAQFETTGLWAEDGAVKWVRVDALVDSADGLFVEVATGAPALPDMPVEVTAIGNEWLVDTGAAEYRIGSDGALIKEVSVGGHTVAQEGHLRGLYLVDQNGETAQASARGAQVTVEAEGPVTASLRIEGDYRNAAGERVARHITRLEFFAGRPEARVTHTLVLTEDTNRVWFQEAGWEFEISAGSDPRAWLGISALDSAEFLEVDLDATGTVLMAQEDGLRLGIRPRANRPSDVRWITRTLGEDSFTIRDAGGRELHTGAQMGDWVAVANDGFGFMAACRAAAAQHPKDFEINDQSLTLRLFSPAGGMEMDFRMEALMERWGIWPLDALDFEMTEADWQRERLKRVAQHSSNAIGWAKTHSLVFAPLMAADLPDQAGQKVALMTDEPFAYIDPAWLYKTLALGALHPRDTERFPVAETVIDGVFWNQAERLPGPYTGYFDYFAGPHYGHPGRYRLTYTYLSDAWLLYARSGDRSIREFAQGTNRAFMDNYISHWEGPNKTRGLFLRAVTGPDNTGKTEFPMYWETMSTFSMSTTSNLHRGMLDYYLTGYRRGGDIIRQFADGMAEAWDPATRDWRAILTLRLLAQAYGFTWDERLRALIEKTAFDAEARIYDPEGEVLLSKDRPYQSSTYKTPTDVDVFIEVGDLLGSAHAYRIAEVLGRHIWERDGISGRATGVSAHFLWETTESPMLATDIDHFMRVSGLLLRDPQSGDVQGLGWSQVARIFQGLPLAMDVMVRTNADREAPASSLAFTINAVPASVFVDKPDDAAVSLLLRGPRPEGLGVTGEALVLKPHARAPRIWPGQDLHLVSERSGGYTRVRIPKDAPGGIYEIVLNRPGKYTILADKRVPLSLYAAQGWQPAPLRPALPVYFKVPGDGSNARIHFENGARLITPTGNPFRNGAVLSGWVDLPTTQEGVWSFVAVDPGMVQTDNFSATFALGNPTFHLSAKPMAVQQSGPQQDDDD